MSFSIFLLWMIFSTPVVVFSQSAPRGFLLNCGAKAPVTIDNLKYISDHGYTSVGNSSTLKQQDLVPLLATLRYFPDKSARKYCFEFPVSKGGKYLVRTTYYYGSFDDGKEPPLFDQIIGGTKWSIVNTTEDFKNGMSSYYEIVFETPVKTLSVCLARNNLTLSSPFISAVEVEFLEDYVYNTTDIKKYALSVVQRTSFGTIDELIGYPDDRYNRLWEPFKDMNPLVENHSVVSTSDFWNQPPAKAFMSGITTSRGKKLQIQWPSFSLPSTKYYIALYFQDNRGPSPYSWRVFDVSVNGKTFYSNLNVTADGVMVYAAQWPLSGMTDITLTPVMDMPVGPVINAAEVFQLLPFGQRTNTRDVTAMSDLSRTIDNPPSDWSGDPCFPRDNSWTGVTCSKDDLARVISLDLTKHGLAGTISPSVNNMTALRDLWLGNNKLTGPIPEMGSLLQLETLHLENNQFDGQIPQSLGRLPKLRELFIQNNMLTGAIPDAIKWKKGLNFQFTPGNTLS